MTEFVRRGSAARHVDVPLDETDVGVALDYLVDRCWAGGRGSAVDLLRGAEPVEDASATCVRVRAVCLGLVLEFEGCVIDEDSPSDSAFLASTCRDDAGSTDGDSPADQQPHCSGGLRCYDQRAALLRLRKYIASKSSKRRASASGGADTAKSLFAWLTQSRVRALGEEPSMMSSSSRDGSESAPTADTLHLLAQVDAAVYSLAIAVVSCMIYCECVPSDRVASTEPSVDETGQRAARLRARLDLKTLYHGLVGEFSRDTSRVEDDDDNRGDEA